MPAPADGVMEVWAAGVTYRRSREARVLESERAADVYELVYDAERPELFFKSVVWRVTGDGGRIAVRSDSEIDAGGQSRHLPAAADAADQHVGDQSAPVLVQPGRHLVEPVDVGDREPGRAGGNAQVRLCSHAGGRGRPPRDHVGETAGVGGVPVGVLAGPGGPAGLGPPAGQRALADGPFVIGGKSGSAVEMAW
ncbi:hypothetical protein [Nonomuraea sp. NPDC049480]|uniref:hypothetical protein n=1 Tax=Nonomuraea sp. NPDC049480 TaxID=3364353 RepID=UPI00379043B1